MAAKQSITEQRKKDRERQARRRAKLKAANAPQTHDIERAVTEALGFQMKRWLIDLGREDAEQIIAPLISVIETILVDRLQFDRSESRKAVKRLLRPRPGHYSAFSMPSLVQRDSILMR